MFFWQQICGKQANLNRYENNAFSVFLGYNQFIGDHLTTTTGYGALRDQ